METKQTAVDWLIEILWAPCWGIPSDIIEQAQQMDKEQKIEFAKKVLDKAECSHTGMVYLDGDIEDIYNETYKQ
jgi:hypothetical protein